MVWTQDEPDGTIVGISFYEPLCPPPGIDLDASIEIAPGALAVKLGLTEAELGPRSTTPIPWAAPGPAGRAFSSKPAGVAQETPK